MENQEAWVVKGGNRHHHPDRFGNREPQLVEACAEVGIQRQRLSVAL